MPKSKETGTGGLQGQDQIQAQGQGQSPGQLKGPGQVDPVAPRRKTQSFQSIDLKNRDPLDLNSHVRVSLSLAGACGVGLVYLFYK